MRIELSVPMSAEEISAAVGGSICGAHGKVITHVVTDSAEAKMGDLFIAIKGKQFDGEEYADEAIHKGALSLSGRRKSYGIAVTDTSTALLNIASYYLKKLPYIKYKIAITGSVGKTTTKEFLKVLLNEKYVTHASKGNLNNEIGMPLTVLSTPKNAEAVICEMGMNHSGEISRMSKALCPDIAIITNVGTAHIGNLGSKENIAKAKLEVVDGSKDALLIIPKSEPLLSGAKGALTFALNDDTADFHLLEQHDKKIAFYKNKALIFSGRFAFSDAHLLDCLSASLSAAVMCGLTSAELNRGVFKISGENIRQKIINKKSVDFYNDCYNASEESVYSSCKSLLAIPHYTVKSAVLGDVLELGEHSEAIHRRIGKSLCGYNLSRLYLFGNQSAFIRDGAIEGGFPPECIFYNSDATRPDITAAQIKESSARGEIILLKASRAMRLERILDFFD
ncbi:MAG: UDP-N-acetylmuramoyl-tripeptide--D-alanyl-D-alanine ligase [Ruminococcaceae bacterium]|nr:UDP-N-acetylmuramoyl-tripeptide--D-alanyl-D-alanine ligase [Oscillospiraceae bacterium]